MEKARIRASRKVQVQEGDRDWALEAGLGDQTEPPLEVDTSSIKAIPENDGSGDSENPDDSRREFLESHLRR